MGIRARIWLLASASIGALLWIHFDVQTRTAHRKDSLQHEHTAIATNCSVPNGFGKTHFIVGYPAEKTAEQCRRQESIAQQKEPAHEGPFGFICEGRVRQVFFAPDDRVQDALIHLIDHEKKAIKIAAFVFTNGEIAKAVLAAQKRGVQIELVVDATGIRDRFNKIKLFRERGVPIFVYNINSDDTAAGYMHNKFALFSHNLLERPLVWTGSCNFTRAAHEKNQENAVILDEEWIVQKYAQQFEQLKKRSTVYRMHKRVAQA